MKEWHFLVGPIPPGRLVGRLVPCLLHADEEVIIGLPVVGAKVPSLPKVSGPRLHALGLISQSRFTMILEPCSRSQYTGSQSGTGHRTNGGIRKGVIEGQSFGGEFLDCRHSPEFGAIVPQVMHGVILGQQEHYVWPLGRLGNKGEEKAGNSR